MPFFAKKENEGENAAGNNDEEKSSTLNNFFSSVFTTENNSNIPEFKDRISDDKHIHSASTTEDEMKELLRNLKPNKSPGTDQIHPFLLRECASYLASHSVFSLT